MQLSANLESYQFNPKDSSYVLTCENIASDESNLLEEITYLSRVFDQHERGTSVNYATEAYYLDRVNYLFLSEGGILNNPEFVETNAGSISTLLFNAFLRASQHVSRDQEMYPDDEAEQINQMRPLYDEIQNRLYVDEYVGYALPPEVSVSLLRRYEEYLEDGGCIPELDVLSLGLINEINVQSMLSMEDIEEESLDNIGDYLTKFQDIKRTVKNYLDIKGLRNINTIHGIEPDPDPNPFQRYGRPIAELIDGLQRKIWLATPSPEDEIVSRTLSLFSDLNTVFGYQANIRIKLLIWRLKHSYTTRNNVA